MKKSMTVLLIIISTLVSIAFGFSMQAKDMEYINTIENTERSFKVYIKNSDVDKEVFFKTLMDLNKDFNASIIRTDLVNREHQIICKSAIFSKEFLENNNIKLKSGRLPENNKELVATYNTKDENQVGYIKDLFNDTPMILQSMEEFIKETSKDVNGVYTIDVSSEFKNEILQIIGISTNCEVDDLLKPYYDQEFGEGTLYLLSIILAIIMAAVFCLMCVFYPISRLKEIGVYKLNGYKDKSIWKELNFNILVVPLLFYFFSIVIQKITFPSMDLLYFIKLTLLQLFILFICFLISLVTLYWIRRYSISSMLKGYFNFKFSLYFCYILKFLIFFGLIFTIPKMSDEVSRMIKELSVSHAYEAQSEYVTLSSFSFVDDEFQDALAGKGTLINKLNSFFAEIEKTADAGFVQASWIDEQYLNGFSSVLSNTLTPESDIEFGSMMVNENYFKRLDLNYHVNEDVFDKEELVILAPEEFREKEDILNYYGSVILYQLQEKNKTDDVIIKYYNNSNKRVFSESLQLTNDNHAFFYNPVYVCLNDIYTKKFGAFLTSEAISNPIRILNSKENRLAINKAILNNDLQLNNLEFNNVLNSGYKQQIDISKSSSIVWLLIMMLIILVSIVSSYYIILTILISRKKEIFVKKILGFSLFDRYKAELIFFVILYLLAFIVLFILTKNILSCGIYLFLVIIDFSVVMNLIHSKEKNHLNYILKGEE